MKAIVVALLFLAVTMPIVYLLGPRPSIAQMVDNLTQAKARAPIAAGPGDHASSPIAAALERHPTASVLLFCGLAIATVILAFAIGALVYKVIGPVRARPARRVL
jgi:hypothetical protein